MCTVFTWIRARPGGAKLVVTVVVDPEIYMLLDEIFHLDPILANNVFLLPPIFHLGKHIIETLLSDPIFASLVFALFVTV